VTNLRAASAALSFAAKKIFIAFIIISSWLAFTRQII